MVAATGAADAIEGDGEASRPDPGNIDHRERQHLDQVALDRLAVLPDGADAVPGGPRRPGVRQRPHSRAVGTVEEDPVGADQLQRIPLDGIVTGGEDEACAGVVVLHRQLNRRRRGDADVDDVDPDRHQAGRCRPREHRPAGPGITPEHNQRFATGPGPGTQGGSVPCDEFRGEIAPHDPAHSRDTDHQGVRHDAKASGCRGAVECGRSASEQERIGIGELGTKGTDRFGVEMGADAGFQLAQRAAGREGAPVGAIRRHRVEGIGDGHDPGGPGDLLSVQAVGEAGAVEALMV